MRFAARIILGHRSAGRAARGAWSPATEVVMEKRMKTLIVALAALSLTALPARAAGSWTFLLYIVADDNDSADLENAAIRDMQGLARNGPPPGATFLVQVDRGKKLSSLMQETYSDPNYSGAVRYRIEKGSFRVLAKPGEVNSGDPKALLDFVTWGLAAAPADRVMLVISSHGSGTMSWRGTGAVGSPQPGLVRLDSASSYVAYDDTDDDCLTLFELARVLDVVREKRGRPIEILGLDACLSATVEALYQLRNGCDLIVADAATIPMSGFVYSAPVAALWGEPAMAPEKLAETFVKAFIDAQDSGDNVLGSFRTAAAEDLVGAVDRMSIELIRAHRQVGAIKLSNLTAYGKSSLYWDLKRIAERLADPATDLRGAGNAAEIRQAARDVLDARKAAVASLWYMGAYADAKVGGLSIYWPDADPYKKHRSFYKVLASSQSAHWDEYIDLRELGLAAPQP
jgi:hypothetical protein